jgi:hypothetical protein
VTDWGGNMTGLLVVYWDFVARFLVMDWGSNMTGLLVVYWDLMASFLVVYWGSGVVDGSRLVERSFRVSLLSHESLIHL